MDPFGRNFLSGEEDAMDCCESEEERRQYSSEEDDIDEIEEALLQRIHYAEDYEEDSSPGEEEESRSPRQQMSTNTFPHIKVASIKRDNVELQNTFQIKVPFIGDIKNSDESGILTETLDVTVMLESNESSQKDASIKTVETMNEKLAPACQDAEENYVSAISIDSDSDQDSKYKYILKSKLNSKISGDAENSVIEISSDSRDEDDRLTRISSTQCKDEIEAISISSSHSDVDSISSEVVEIPQEGIAIDEPPPLSAKRKWSKSAGASDDGSGALRQDMPAKKVKLKRSTSNVSELRQILNAIKEEVLGDGDDLSSEGDLSGAMVIESHSEDEALDVHFTNLGEGRYYQNEGNLFCYKCKRSGHRTQDCTNQKKTKVVTCILCGTQGHNDRQCPDRLCFICTEVGHQAKDCTNKKFRYMTCHRCSMRGHTAQFCPDRWRQYHLTTEPGNIIRYKGTKADQSVSVNGKVYCYNCSLEGHFGHECMEEPMDRNAPLILPYVVKYDFIPRRFWNVQMDHCPPLADSTVNPLEEEKADFRVNHSGLMQGKEAKRKQKRTEEELKSIQSKKCRLKTDEEKEYDHKISVFLKEKTQRIKRQRYKESLDREEVLDDYEKTNSYIQKGGHVLRKRDRSTRRQYVAEEQPREIKQNNLPQKTKVKIKKKKEKKLRKKLKRQQDRADFQELKRQYQKQKKLDKQQQVTFRPSQELFEKDLFGEEHHNFDSQKDLGQTKGTQSAKAKNNRSQQDRADFQELKCQYQKQKKLDKQQQVTFRPSQELFEKDLFGEENHNFDSQNDLEQSKGTQSAKAKNNRRRQRRRQLSEADVHKQFKRQLPKDMGKPVGEPEEAASPTTLTKRQKRKKKKLLRQANDKLYHTRVSQAYRDQKEWKRQQKAMGQRFISDKGFRVQPRY